jgi:ribosome-binding protein aMBF1 (putative translation factor)
MAKTHRGKGIRSLVSQGRGACPLCGRTGVKVVFEITVNEKTLKLCKTCKAAVSHGKMRKEAEALASAAPAPSSGPSA